MATRTKNIKEVTRQRLSSDGSISSSTKSTGISNIRKSASFASNSSYPLQEQMKLTSDDHLCSGITLAGGAGKESDSLHLTINPEESISSAIKVTLQPYTKTPQTSLEDKKVSQIYDTVGKAVADMVENVTVQQSPKGAKPTELRVAEHPVKVTVKSINEKNLPMSQCSLSPPVSPTPGTIGIEKQSSVETNKSAPQSASSQRSISSGSSSSKRPDSVETNRSAPQSASSQRSISSGSSISKRPDSVKTDDSAPHSASSQRSSQSPGDKCYSSIITDNTNESIPAKVKCYSYVFIHVMQPYGYSVAMQMFTIIKLLLALQKPSMFTFTLNF